MIEGVLIDTNILIYFLKRDITMIDFLEKFGDKTIYISIISWIEALTGSHHHGKKIKEMEKDLEYFKRLPITEDTARTIAAISQRKILKKQRIHFQDTLIGATALNYHLPLITNNPQDFKSINGLTIIALES